MGSPVFAHTEEVEKRAGGLVLCTGKIQGVCVCVWMCVGLHMCETEEGLSAVTPFPEWVCGHEGRHRGGHRGVRAFSH